MPCPRPPPCLLCPHVCPNKGHNVNPSFMNMPPIASGLELSRGSLTHPSWEKKTTYTRENSCVEGGFGTEGFCLSCDDQLIHRRLFDATVKFQHVF